VLFRDPESYLAIVRRQLDDLSAQVELTTKALDAQTRAADVLPLTRSRCQALADASRQQFDDVAALLTPLLSAASGERAVDSSVETPSLLTNIHYLFRDWAWPASDDDENAASLASLERLLDGRRPGATLVLGAGACRLAVDLHRRNGEGETVALDIDALLLSAAAAIVAGREVDITEGYADINQTAKSAIRWTLRAPRPPADDRFHFVLADGLHPPFAAHSFDTVVTPWFIDAIPTDLRDLIGVVARLLRPSGRWASIGPLRYGQDVPVARRFSYEEIRELADRAGLRIRGCESATRPSLVSPLTGRGRLEWVAAFCAEKIEGEPGGDRPPAWLLFGHLPVPAFSGQQLLTPADPLARLVVTAIDGRRSLDDLVDLVGHNIGPSQLTKTHVREAVRRCVAEIHPSCRS
jgi:SAM-dependent methyltransferase